MSNRINSFHCYEHFLYSAKEETAFTVKICTISKRLYVTFCKEIVLDNMARTYVKLLIDIINEDLVLYLLHLNYYSSCM